MKFLVYNRETGKMKSLWVVIAPFILALFLLGALFTSIYRDYSSHKATVSDLNSSLEKESSRVSDLKEENNELTDLVNSKVSEINHLEGSLEEVLEDYESTLVHFESSMDDLESKLKILKEED